MSRIYIDPYWMYLSNSHQPDDYANLYKGGILNIIDNQLKNWTDLSSKNGVYYPNKEVDDFTLSDSSKNKECMSRNQNHLINLEQEV